ADTRRPLAPAAGMTTEGARRRKLTQSMTDHVLGHIHRHMGLTVMHGDRQPHHQRQDRRGARPGLDHALLATPSHRLRVLEQRWMDVGAFLCRTRHAALPPFRLTAPAGVASPQNILVGILVVARAEAKRRLAPRRLWLAADRRATLAATMW